MAAPMPAPVPPADDWTLADLPAPIQAVLIDWLAAGARARLAADAGAADAVAPAPVREEAART